jgi:hypothetical protein
LLLRAVDQANRSHRQKTFAALKLSAYRIYFGALLMQMVARSWFMYEPTGSAVMLGAAGLGGALPMLTVSRFLASMSSRKRGLLFLFKKYKPRLSF